MTDEQNEVTEPTAAETLTENDSASTIEDVKIPLDSDGAPEADTSAEIDLAETEVAHDSNEILMASVFKMSDSLAYTVVYGDGHRESYKDAASLFDGLHAHFVV